MINYKLIHVDNLTTVGLGEMRYDDLYVTFSSQGSTLQQRSLIGHTTTTYTSVNMLIRDKKTIV